MPELPEVTTIVNQLREVLVGRTIVKVDPRLPKSWHDNGRTVAGSKIVDVRRRAKMIIIKLDHELNLLIHLKMTGQLIYGESGSGNQESGVVSFPDPIPFAGTTLPGKTTHVVFSLSGGGKLFFNDMRQFGWVKVLDDDDLNELSEKHGPEALSDEFTPEYLEEICHNWGRPIKLLLLEQSKIAGIGNIYANEALWYAGISPMKRGRELTTQQIKKLAEGIREVLKMGIEYHGSSAGDEAYVDAFGHGGKMQEHTIVYQKAGSDCPRCHHKIVR